MASSAWSFQTGRATLLILLMILAAVSHARTITLATVHYPPYSIIGEDGTISGMDVDVIRTVFQQADIDVSFSHIPWQRALKSTQRGRIDGLFSCIYSKERAEYLLFSKPISHITHGALARTDTQLPSLKTRADLKPYGVAVVNGWTSHKELADAGFRVVPSDTMELALNTVLYRGVTAFYGGLEAALYEAKQMLVDNRLSRYSLSDKPRRPLYLCLSKNRSDNETLLETFNQGLEKLKRSGEFTTIQQRYGQ